MGAGSSLDKASEKNQEQPCKDNNASLSSHSDEKDELVSLPYNCEAILGQADSAVDRSSTENQLEQLHAGVFLKEKKEKYWVEKDSNRNCFMVFAGNLSITWAEDNRFWHWPLLKESSDESDHVQVAELRNVCWLEVHGKFETARLTPRTAYRVVFVVQLKDPAYGWEVPVNVRLVLPDGTKQERKENLMEKPRGKWIEIQAGEIETSLPEKVGGEIEFSMFEYEGGKWKRGLLIKGVQIKPKASVVI